MSKATGEGKYMLLITGQLSKDGTEEPLEVFVEGSYIINSVNWGGKDKFERQRTGRIKLRDGKGGISKDSGAVV